MVGAQTQTAHLLNLTDRRTYPNLAKSKNSKALGNRPHQPSASFPPGHGINK